ncbi:MAG: Protein translocase subunit SecY [bacterium 42_11]|nr:MAG: Protein translocase subunit SecY [bacterium 42_11]
MFEAIRNLFRLPDLKSRILFTLFILFVYRLGAHIPMPGVDTAALMNLFSKGGILGFIDLFAGGALRRFSIFALGVAPYINSAIVMQLLTVVIPYLEKLSKEGEEGRKKITQYTRYGTILFAAIQSFGLTYWLQHLGVLYDTGWLARLIIVSTVTTGSVLLMWLGEQISDHGIGNGISIIIFSGIVARIPESLAQTFSLVSVGEINFISLVLFAVIAVLVIAGVVLVQEGQRRLPVQYAKRIVGRQIYGGQSTFLPLRVNMGGVIPIIFASSILIFPSTIAQFLPESFQGVLSIFRPGHPVYMISYALLIIFFTYFYTAVIFNPADVAENLKKYGGFIPGIRPGKPTADYIERILARITLGGAVFLAGIALLPVILTRVVNINTFYFGGTALLIVVGVALETVHQIEAYLIMRHYEGFIKRKGGKELFRF